MKVRGFTLIELLVVLAIIGLLSSIVLASLNTARAKARDAVRKSQVGEFEKALELYFLVNGHYPCGKLLCLQLQAKGVSPLTSDRMSNSGFELVSGGFISSIPSDPIYPAGAANQARSCNAKDGAGYCYCSDGTDSYVLTVNTEDDKGGSDRCYIRVGPSSADFCTSHQFPGQWAQQDCSTRF